MYAWTSVLVYYGNMHGRSRALYFTLSNMLRWHHVLKYLDKVERVASPRTAFTLSIQEMPLLVSFLMSRGQCVLLKVNSLPH